MMNRLINLVRYIFPPQMFVLIYLAGNVLAAMGTRYRGISNNCQTFCESLFQCIRTMLNMETCHDGITVVPPQVRDDILLRRAQEVLSSSGLASAVPTDAPLKRPLTVERVTIWIMRTLLATFVLSIPELWRQLSASMFFINSSVMMLLGLDVWFDHLAGRIKASTLPEEVAMTTLIRNFGLVSGDMNFARHMQDAILEQQPQIPGAWISEAQSEENVFSQYVY